MFLPKNNKKKKNTEMLSPFIVITGISDTDLYTYAHILRFGANTVKNIDD